MKTKYFVNEDKRIVVCVLEIQEYCCEPDLIVRATAVCKPEDKFDAEIGKRIANYQAHIALHRHLKKEQKARIKNMEAKIEEIKAENIRRDAIIENLKAQVRNTIEQIESAE